MEKELSIIDGILYNLVATNQLYEFELHHLSTFVSLLKQFQLEKLSELQKQDNLEIFSNESTKELAFYESKLVDLKKKIEILSKDINQRKESKTKLVSLFDSLTKLDDLEKQAQSSPTTQRQDNDDGGEDELPLMEIREELDDDGNVINSELKPYGESNAELINEKTEKAEKSGDKLSEPVIPAKQIEKSIMPKQQQEQQQEKEQDIEDDDSNNNNREEFRPFVIREEVDEDGKIVKSSKNQTPSITGFDPSVVTRDNKEMTGEGEEVNEDQIAELLKDMGLEGLISDKKTNRLTKITNGNNDEDEVKEPLDTEVTTTDNVEETPSADYKPAIDPSDLLTLEILADDLLESQDDDEDGAYPDFADDEEWEFEDDDGEEGDEDDDGGVDVVPTPAQSLFWRQIQELRTQKQEHLEKSVAPVSEQSSEGSSSKDESLVSKEEENAKKPKKKSVKFSETNEIKEVENIWDDLRKSEVENKQRVSQFKLQRLSNQSSSSTFTNNDEIAFPSADSTELTDSVMNDIVIERSIHEDQHPKTISRGNSNRNKAFASSQATAKALPKLKLESKLAEDGLIKISKSSTKTSRFKASRFGKLPTSLKSTMINTNAVLPKDPVKESFVGDIISDIVENDEPVVGDVVERESPMVTDRSEKNAPVANDTIEKKHPIVSDIVEKDVPSVAATNSNPFTKSKFSSLKPVRPIKSNTRSKPSPINVPVEVNPIIANPEYHDEDFEVVRREISDDDENDENSHLVEDADTEDKDYGRSNVSTKAHFERSKVKIQENDDDDSAHPLTTKEVQYVDTTLDYQSLQDDMDTMAKAYVLGLYDDDIETEGQVIEHLKDFEEHNATVEAKEAQTIVIPGEGQGEEQEEAVDESEFDATNGPVLMDKIIERDPAELAEENAIPDDEFDIILDDEVLNTTVAVDYSRLRNKMVQQYNGGYSKSDKEKEFEPIEEVNVSRFKSARLGMNNLNN